MADKVVNTQIFDDSDDQDVVHVRKMLRSALALHMALDAADTVCLNYYLGKQWTVLRSSNNMMPQVQLQAPFRRTVANLLAPNVRQWHARLMVRNWDSKFEPLDESLDTEITARQLQAWWNRFNPFANLSQFFGNLNLARLVMTSALATYTFDPDAPGGVRMIRRPRPTLDPANPDPNLDNHESVLFSYVLSAPQAIRMFGKVLEKKKARLESTAKIPDLVAGESHLSRARFQAQPGATLSETTGVILHVLFRDYGQSRVLMVENPKPAGTGYVAPQWWAVEKNKEWPYGLGTLKLNCFPHPACAFHRSLVSEGIPQQDLINLAHKEEYQAAVYANIRRLVVQEGMVINLDEVRSNKPFAVVRVRQGATIAPQYMQQTPGNINVEKLIQRSVMWLKETMSVQDPMQGRATGRVESNVAYQTLIEQGSAPIQSLADNDYEACNKFFGEMGRSALLHYGRTSPKKYIQLVGTDRASLETVKWALDAMKKYPTRCVLRRGAFLARAPQDIEAKLDAQLTAGHITKWEHDWELFLQTGYEGAAGQEGGLHNAQVLVRSIRDGTRKPEEIKEFDDQELLKLVLDHELKQRVVMEYDEGQVSRLSRAHLWCEFWLLQRMQRQAALAAMASGGATPTEAGQPAGTSPTAGQAAPGGATPQVATVGA